MNLLIFPVEIINVNAAWVVHLVIYVIFNYAYVFTVGEDRFTPEQPWKNKYKELQWAWLTSLIWMGYLIKKLYVHFELCLWIQFDDLHTRAQNLRNDRRHEVRCTGLAGDSTANYNRTRRCMFCYLHHSECSYPQAEQRMSALKALVPLSSPNGQ